MEVINNTKSRRKGPVSFKKRCKRKYSNDIKHVRMAVKSMTVRVKSHDSHLRIAKLNTTKVAKH